MYYIVGLGNPGEQYAKNRHNVGWMMLDTLIERVGLPAAVMSSKYAGRVSEGMIGGEEVAVLYPETFMNKSGSAVVKLMPKGQHEQLVVVYDDVDLAFGETKVSFGKGDGGHNGIKSIVSSLGTKDFIRVRIGVAHKSFWTGKVKRPSGAALNKHVMGNFSTSELRDLEPIKEQVVHIIETIVKEGLTKAMNQYN